ncbi:MAG: hypothetical protein HQL20_06630 [Candidatus Omnitrophica bacterium]|nr:hypothetical protein [Candidatus Omnitrophota bacterium]
MDYLLHGTDLKLRDKTLADIKNAVLPSPDAARLDFESLDGHKLTPERLKIALFSLPGVAAQRLVHVYHAEKLPKETLEWLLKFLKAEHAQVALVLEADEWDDSTKTRGEVTKFLKKTGVSAPPPMTVFDMMNAVATGNSSGALRGLKVLLTNYEAPERLLGGMVWAWSNRVKGRVAAEVYKKGLLVLQEADIALKRSRFPEREYGLETAVVKLSLLVKPLKA